MKHKLLSTLALACAMFAGSSAFAWDAPTTPSFPVLSSFSGNFVAPENGNSYYIYNVGTGQFLGCGQDWGTRAVTTNEALVTLDGPQWNAAINQNAIVPFKLSHPDPVADGVDESLTGTWMIQNLNTDRAELYLCHEGNSAWFDGDAGRRNTDNNGFWTIAQVGDAYELIPLDGQEGNSIIYGVHLIYMSVNYAYTWTDLKNDAYTGGLWKFVSTDDAAEIQAYIEGLASTTEERQAALNNYNAAVDLYNARLAFYNTLLEADKYGVDATDAGTVYTNEEATIDEINAARETLQSAVNEAGLEYAIRNSSEDAPYEITDYVLTNPNFDDGMTGWTITKGMGNNLQIQSASYTNGDVSIQNFIEAWISSPSTLKDGFICQKVAGLPEGRYRIAADVIAVQQSGAISLDEQMGVYLYYNNGKFIIHSESLSTGNSVPEHYYFDFDYDGAAEMEIGLMTQSTNCNWMGMDNLKLFALGEVQTPPIYTALQDAVSDAEEASYQDYPANAEIIANFLNKLAVAKDLVSSPANKALADQYTEAFDNLNAAIEDLKASIAEYESLHNLYIKNVTIEAGRSATVEIGINNEQTNLVAFQMDVTLPEGISIDAEGCALSSRITDQEQTLVIGKQGENTYRLSSTSLSLTPISGKNGTLLTLKLKAADGSVGGRASISNTRFSTDDSKRVTMPDESFDVNVMYDLVYKVDGEVYKTTGVVYDSALTLEPAPTKEGYTFGGWSELPAKMPAHDVEVTGQFTVNTYTLVYKVDGEEYKTTRVNYGAEIIAEAEPTKEGYTFSGWSEIPATMPAHDVEVTGIFAVNIFTLTYKVDGEVYKSTRYTSGTELTPEAEPTKDGYTFGGWSEIPEAMPSHDVEVTGQFYLYGDVNTDEEVDVVDVVDIARFVVATPSARFREKLADLNSDLMVNIADAVVLINYIVGDQNFVKAESPAAKSFDYDLCQLRVVSREANTLSLDFVGESDFTAMQFEVDLPDGVDVSAIRVNAQRLGGHQLLYNKVSENRYRVAVLSLSNNIFKGNDGELLKITLNEQPNADISIDEVHFVTANATDVKYDALSFDGSATSIDIPSVKTDNIMLFDLQGRRRTTMQRGINIVNGQKIIKR